MKKKCMILLGALSLASSTFAQTWIWYPGDYEIWLGNQNVVLFFLLFGNQTVIM